MTKQATQQTSAKDITVGMTITNLYGDLDRVEHAEKATDGDYYWIRLEGVETFASSSYNDATNKTYSPDELLAVV